MFKSDDSFQTSQNTRKDGLLMLITPIKVLVVDNKRDSLTYVAKELQSYSFEVTCVCHSGAALRLLTEKNKQYDLLLIDGEITGVDIHTFLRITMNMDLLSFVMSEQEDDAFIHEVFLSGAFLVVKKPLTIDALRRMRQDIIRQRMHKQEKRRSKNMITKNERQVSEIPKKRNSNIRKNGGCQPEKQVLQSSHDVVDDNVDDHDDDSIKQKICVEWTKELHEKFLNVLTQLGEGRCFPKKILELMNVPGLTRLQVASHLQNYCKEKQLKANENKTTLPSCIFPGKLNEKKFGIDMSNNEWQTQLNYMNNQTYKDSSTMNISNEKSIAQQVEYTQILYRGFHDFGQGYIYQDFSFIPRQVSQEFPVFLKDLDGNGPNGF